VQTLNRSLPFIITTQKNADLNNFKKSIIFIYFNILIIKKKRRIYEMSFKTVFLLFITSDIIPYKLVTFFSKMSYLISKSNKNIPFRLYSTWSMAQQILVNKFTILVQTKYNKFVSKLHDNSCIMRRCCSWIYSKEE
jgi:hypothetical protein